MVSDATQRTYVVQSRLHIRTLPGCRWAATSAPQLDIDQRYIAARLVQGKHIYMLVKSA